MGNDMKIKLKLVLQRLVETLYVFSLLLGLLAMVGIIGLLVSDVANSLRMTGYLGPAFGVELVVVLFSVVWLPLWFLIELHNSKRG